MTNSTQSTQYYRAVRDIVLEEGNFFQVVVNNNRKVLLTTNVLTESQVDLRLERVNQRLKADNLASGVNFIPTTAQIIPTTISVFSTNPNLANYFPFSITVNREAVISMGDPDTFQVTEYLTSQPLAVEGPYRPLFPEVLTYLYDVNPAQPSYSYRLGFRSVPTHVHTLDVQVGTSLGTTTFILSPSSEEINVFNSTTGIESEIEVPPDIDPVKNWLEMIGNRLMVIGICEPEANSGVLLVDLIQRGVSPFPSIEVSYPDGIYRFTRLADDMIVIVTTYNVEQTDFSITLIRKNCLYSAIPVTGDDIFQIVNNYRDPPPLDDESVIDIVYEHSVTYGLFSLQDPDANANIYRLRFDDPIIQYELVRRLNVPIIIDPDNWDSAARLFVGGDNLLNPIFTVVTLDTVANTISFIHLKTNGSIDTITTDIRDYPSDYPVTEVVRQFVNLIYWTDSTGRLGIFNLSTGEINRIDLPYLYPNIRETFINQYHLSDVGLTRVGSSMEDQTNPSRRLVQHVLPNNRQNNVYKYSSTTFTPLDFKGYNDPISIVLELPQDVSIKDLEIFKFVMDFQFVYSLERVKVNPSRGVAIAPLASTVNEDNFDAAPTRAGGVTRRGVGQRPAAIDDADRVLGLVGEDFSVADWLNLYTAA